MMNNLSWVKLYNAAASDKNGFDELVVSDGLGETTSHLKYEQEGTSTRGVRISVVTLDSLVDQAQILPPDFIKVDVEGHGAKALAGARQSIERKRPTLVMSFHSENELDGTKALLEPLCYSAFDANGIEWSWSSCLYRTAVLRFQP